jgi:flagellar biosynthesis/type III secretory pathway protein FliH
LGTKFPSSRLNPTAYAYTPAAYPPAVSHLAQISQADDHQAQLDKAYREGQIERAFQDGIAHGYQQSVAQGRQEGIARGLQAGLAYGRHEVFAKGNAQGLANGKKEQKRCWIASTAKISSHQVYIHEYEGAQ